MRLNRLQIVVKMVSVCSLYCKYCYWFFESDGAWEKQPKMITSKTINGLSKSVKDVINKLSVKSVDIIFHGGEPMMVKKSLFIELCESINEEVSTTDASANYIIQTNGLHINDEWIKLFRKYKLSVGISLDGPQEYNDLNRVDKKGRGSYSKVIKGLKLLQNEPDPVLSNPFILSVLNPSYDYNIVYNHFRELGITNFDFLLPDINHESNVNNEYVSSIGRALWSLFDAWTKEDKPDLIDFRLFQQQLSCFQNYKEGSDTDSVSDVNEKIVHNRVIGVGAGGDLFVDDSYTATAWYKSLKKRNLQDTSVEKFLLSKPFKEIDEAEDNIPDKCEGCCYVGMCLGGEVFHRYSIEKKFNNPSVYCEGLKYFYSKFVGCLVKNGYPKNEISKKLEEGYQHHFGEKNQPDFNKQPFERKKRIELKTVTL